MTYTRPSNGFAFDATSGSIGIFGVQRPLGALDRNVDEREGGDLLRHAFLEHLEILAREVVDEAALAIEDRRVHLDVVHFDAERDPGLFGGGRPARRPAAAPTDARRRRQAARGRAAIVCACMS